MAFKNRFKLGVFGFRVQGLGQTRRHIGIGENAVSVLSCLDSGRGCFF